MVASFGVTADETRSGARRGHAVDDRDLCDEPVAASAHVANHCLPRPVVTDGRRASFTRVVRFASDTNRWPHTPSEQLDLGDHSVAVLEQVHQEVEGLGLEVHRLVATTQLAARDIELAVPNRCTTASFASSDDPQGSPSGR